MAFNLEGQGEGEFTPTSAMETDEENIELSSCEMALQNDLILRNIFDFLPLPDLKSCRLVNRQWKQSSQDGCIKKCDTIGFFGVSVDKVDFCKLHRFHEMSDLIQLISTSEGGFPCRSFLVECGVAGFLDNPEQEEILANFFHAIAPIAEQLWFDKLGGRKLFNGFPPENLHFPRLKSLELWEGTRYSVKEYRLRNLNFCREIIQHSPQLATLEIVFTSWEAANSALLIPLLESVNRHKFNLHLHVSLNDSFFNKMIGTGLQLRSLWLSFAWGSTMSEDEDSLTNFLSSQSGSLEVLHLRCGKDLRREIGINFPRMEKNNAFMLRNQ